MGVKSFVEGGIAAVIAGCSTHPLDLIKVRLQLHGETPPTAVTLAFPNSPTAFTPTITSSVPKATPISLGINIVKTEGAAALYSGVSATLLRQSLYSTTSMGLYQVLKNKWSDSESGKLDLTRKIGAGLIAGGIGASVGNPADVAMVRMQADGRLPLTQRRNYAGVVDAITKMVKREGVGSLWRGSALTINRAMIVTAAQLASYDQFKEGIMESGVMKDGLGTHVVASFAAGFVAAVASTPVDVIKTRVMNMKVGAYDGVWDCVVKTVRAEGPMAFYKGFVPTVCRQGPFTVVLFVTLEQVRKLLRDF